MILVSDRNMSDTNSNLCPAINGAVGFPSVREWDAFADPLSGAGVPLSCRRPRRPLRTVVGRLNGERAAASDRNGRSPSVPSPPPEPMPPPRDLSIVDSKELIREILRRVGEDPDREGLQQTPARIVRSWKEIYGGYAQRAEDVLVTQFQAEQYDEMVLLRDIEFFSTCEHHMLPFHGKAHIAYLPNKKIVGLSKLARLTDVYTRAGSRCRNV